MKKYFLKNKMCFSLCFLIILAGLMSLLDQYDEIILDANTSDESTDIDRINFAYDPISPIYVYGNGNFGTDWTGNGNPSNPWTLDGKNITASSGQNLITIVDTTEHVVIQNCWLEGGDIAIMLTNASNVKIDNNTILNNYYAGIDITTSENSTIINNQLSYQIQRGISLAGLNNSYIYNNTITNTQDEGILLTGLGTPSLNSTIVFNHISSAGFMGISISDTNKLSICNNKIEDVMYEGIFIGTSENVAVLNNEVYSLLDSSSAGLTIADVNNSYVYNNTIKDLLGYSGVNIFSSFNVTADTNWIENITITESTPDGPSVSPQVGIFQMNSYNCTIFNNTLKLTRGIIIHETGNNTITNNTITDSGCGIEVSNSKENIVANNSLQNIDTYGIQIEYSEDVLVDTNTIVDFNDTGILIEDSFNCTLSDNGINRSSYSQNLYGIRLYANTEISMLDNKLVNATIWFDGYDVTHYYLKKETGNTINGYPVFYLRDTTGTTLSGGNGQYILVNCRDVEITEIDFSNTFGGLFAAYCAELNISYNTINDHPLPDITSMTIGLDFSPFQLPIYLINSNTSELIGNNDSFGIIASYSDQNKFLNNTVLVIGVTTGSTNNVIANNSLFAIQVTDSPGNTILDNNLTIGGLFVGSYYFEDLSNYLQTEVDNNFLDGRPIVYLLNQDGVSLPSNPGQVYLINCDNIELANIEFSAILPSVIIFGCTNINIHDNTFNSTLMMSALRVVQSESCHIYANTILDTFAIGTGLISLVDTNNSDIVDNVLENNVASSIYLTNSNYNTISGNTLVGSTGYPEYSMWLIVNSITLQQSNNNDILDNTVSNNSQSNGIYIIMSNHTLIQGNTVYNNSLRGIYIDGEYDYYSDRYLNSTDNTIDSNDIEKNGNYGIYCTEYTSANTFEWNDLIDNNEVNPAATSQAYDDGLTNLFANNFWNEHTSPDTNSDGIVDIDYPINGPANNSDEQPRTHMISVHALTDPIVTSPNGGELLAGTITISWTAATDNRDHLITYTVSYSADGGSHWTEIDEVTGTSLAWDTTTVANGDNYLIKVSATCSGGLTTEDESDTIFTIDQPEAPQVTVTYPNGGETLSGSATITWSASDPDEDALTYTIYYTTGTNWIEIATGVTATSYDWDTTAVADGTSYKIRVVASDGTFTAEDESDATFTIDNVPGGTSTTTTTTSGTPGFETMTIFSMMLVLGLVSIIRKRKKK